MGKPSWGRPYRPPPWPRRGVACSLRGLVGQRVLQGGLGGLLLACEGTGLSQS